MTVADLNGDGKPDLIVTYGTSNNVAVFLNTTTTPTAPTFAAAQTYAVNGRPVSIAVSDLNGDGKPDLAVAVDSASTGVNGVSVLLNTAGPSTPLFAAAQFAPVPNTVNSVAVGDFNGDGKPDLPVASYNYGNDSGSGAASVLLNTTATRARPPPLFAAR